MAIIQIKRRTSNGTGPLIGTSGTVKAGEPLVDLNGGNLYISKKDKVATSENPLTINDYLEYVSTPNAESIIDSKISELSLGTAAKKNTGTTNGTVPLIGANGKLPISVIPNVSPVTSVNSKTGAVTITLSDLGGVSATTYNSHIGSNLHLTDDQRTRIDNVYNSSLNYGTKAQQVMSSSEFLDSTLDSGLVLYSVFINSYKPGKLTQFVGINKNSVLTPNSIIDGGTF